MKGKETIEYLDLKSLVPFRNHPFKLRNGEEKEQLLQSIKTGRHRAADRPSSFGKCIRSHIRTQKNRDLQRTRYGKDTCYRPKSDRRASGFHDGGRQPAQGKFLPSERAFAYKMKWDAAKKSEKTLSQPATRIRNDDVIAQSFGIGKDTLHRYIRLTCLIPELLDMVDEGRIALTPAVELSYLTHEEQQALLNEIEYADATPSLSQTQRLRGFSRQGRLTADVIFAVMSEEKANQKEQIRFPKEKIQKYFPKSYTGKDMQNTILKLLEKWQRQRERNEREER